MNYRTIKSEHAQTPRLQGVTVEAVIVDSQVKGLTLTDLRGCRLRITPLWESLALSEPVPPKKWVATLREGGLVGRCGEWDTELEAQKAVEQVRSLGVTVELHEQEDTNWHSRTIQAKEKWGE